MRNKAFTLIELLIVVAIIAILAAIAVPNFMEAQIRSKVSRGRTDMRSLDVAIESYRVDTNRYPQFASSICGALLLTSPIAYLSVLPEDPFAPILSTDTGYASVIAMYGSPLKRYYIYNGPNAFTSNNVAEKFNIRWVTTCLGPDRGWFDNTNCSDKHYPEYDPSNGTVSRGNIERVGPGNIPMGRFRNLWDNALW